MDKANIKELFERYREGLCTAEEIELLHRWLMDGKFEPSEMPEEDMLEDLRQLESSLPVKQYRQSYSLRRIIAYAASVLFILGLGYYAYQTFIPVSGTMGTDKQTASLDPGSNKAILKLDDGSSMPLDIAERDSVIHIDGSTVQLNSTGQLVYLSREEDIIKNHQIITPKGGQYEVVLPDGTHVWLNSTSQLRFTNTFEALPERRVELEGEAYFKVSRNVDQPFIVTVRGQEVKVLGTEFNINAYQENDYVKASLVEGSVLFNQNRLEPGQSAIYNDHRTSIQEENIDDIIAWKNGYFVFFEEPLEEAMKKISRWYDLDISFADNDAKSILFGGSISKYENARELFDMIEKAGNVKINANGRTVTITKIKTDKIGG